MAVPLPSKQAKGVRFPYPALMKLIELIDVLCRNGDLPLNLYLPNGQIVPGHFHVTEVGVVTKKFVDCGGVWRESSYCNIQVWVANDTEHRLQASKLVKIIRFAASQVPLELPVVIEYQDQSLALYDLKATGRLAGHWVNLMLEQKNTACLAPDKCGVKGCC